MPHQAAIEAKCSVLGNYSARFCQKRLPRLLLLDHEQLCRAAHQCRGCPSASCRTCICRMHGSCQHSSLQYRGGVQVDCIDLCCQSKQTLLGQSGTGWFCQVFRTGQRTDSSKLRDVLTQCPLQEPVCAKLAHEPHRKVMSMLLALSFMHAVDSARHSNACAHRHPAITCMAVIGAMLAAFTCIAIRSSEGFMGSIAYERSSRH